MNYVSSITYFIGRTINHNTLNLVLCSCVLRSFFLCTAHPQPSVNYSVWHWATVACTAYFFFLLVQEQRDDSIPRLWAWCWYEEDGPTGYSYVYFEYPCLSLPAYITSILQIGALVALDMVNWIFYGLWKAAFLSFAFIHDLWSYNADIVKTG